MSLKPMYVWDGSAWVQVGDASTPQTTIDIAQSAPQGAITGSIWYDDDAGGLFVYDGSYWVNISGPQGPQGATGATGPQGPIGESPDTSIFLTYSTASTIYLNQDSASSTYLTQLSASNIYLTQEYYSSASANLVTLNDVQTLTNKTLEDIIISSASINNGVIFDSVIKGLKENVIIVGSSATGTINLNVEDSSILYYTSNSTANHTLNIRYNSSNTLNSKILVGESVTVTWINTNGSTAYYPTVYQIDGSSVSPLWQGGTAPSSGNSSSTDIYTLTIIKTSITPTYVVLASQTQFKA
jgi:hypothetical protein